jgi:hypothetical protein
MVRAWARPIGYGGDLGAPPIVVVAAIVVRPAAAAAERMRSSVRGTAPGLALRAASRRRCAATEAASADIQR